MTIDVCMFSCSLSLCRTNLCTCRKSEFSKQDIHYNGLQHMCLLIQNCLFCIFIFIGSNFHRYQTSNLDSIILRGNSFFFFFFYSTVPVRSQYRWQTDIMQDNYLNVCFFFPWEYSISSPFCCGLWLSNKEQRIQLQAVWIFNAAERWTQCSTTLQMEREGERRRGCLIYKSPSLACVPPCEFAHF